MSKVLLIGFNPPPFQSGSKVEAAHYRTWQFLQPLLDCGHTVCLCIEQGSKHPTGASIPENLRWESIPFEKIGWSRRLQQVHDVFQPDCVVAVDFYSSLYATKLHTTRPIWMDIYGDPLTIKQVGQYRAGSDQGIGTAIALLQKVLQSGDVFSACGEPQKHALVGELAMCGRLNSRTFGYEFVHAIYPGAPSIPNHERDASDRTFLQAHGVPPDAFLVLWCGGYNTWTDVSTLYRALDWAMERNPRIRFVSVGASTYQGADTTYNHFVAQALASPHAARYHFLGWRQWMEIPDFYRASDVGISIDTPHYETVYGTRTRLMEMLAHGLPVITSTGCELSYILVDKRCGLGFSAGDWGHLGEIILRLANNPEEIESMRQSALSLVSKDLAFPATTGPLLDWVNAPRLAPDHSENALAVKLLSLTYQARTKARMFLWLLGLSGRHA